MSYYESYNHATNTLAVEKLHVRRLKLCLTFAKNCEKNPKYATWFKLSESTNPSSINTRGGVNRKPKYTPVPSRTDRYEKSPIPFLTELLNDYYSGKQRAITIQALYSKIKIYCIQLDIYECKKWIIARKTSYWTIGHMTIVSTCVDLPHHFDEIHPYLLFIIMLAS